MHRSLVGAMDQGGQTMIRHYEEIDTPFESLSDAASGTCMTLQYSETGQALKVRFVPSRSELPNESSGSGGLPCKENFGGVSFKLLRRFDFGDTGMHSRLHT
jgi:hypothetical protein